MTVDVVVVGSLNLDRAYTMARLPCEGETLHASGQMLSSGGKGANQAVAAAKLGAQVALVGAVGDDEAGRLLLELVAAEDVDVARVRRTKTSPTGEAVIFVDDYGRNLIVVSEGANAELTRDDVTRDFPPARWVVAGFEVPDRCVVAAAKHAERAGASFILNPSPYRQIAADLIGRVAVMVMNEHELMAATGVAADAQSRWTMQAARSALRTEELVVTLGARGAVIVTADETTHVAAPKVTPVDTSGAGDAFMGALVARLAAGDSVERAVGLAVTAGSFATTKRGTQTSYATAHELELWRQAVSTDHPAG